MYNGLDDHVYDFAFDWSLFTTQWGGLPAMVKFGPAVTYRERDFAGAITEFEKTLEMRPDDGPSKLYVDRCQHFIDEPPPNDWDGVWALFDDAIGLERLRLFHINDSKHPLGSRVDRHEHLGQGSLGVEPFRRLMNDERFASVPKLLETPKEGDPLKYDAMNLDFLRGLRD